MRIKLSTRNSIKCNILYGEEKAKHTELTERQKAEIEFCQFHCPHSKEDCKGECDEFIKWKKEQRKRC